eukprot:10850343-Prorocentrum_lima.AAC.1
MMAMEMTRMMTGILHPLALVVHRFHTLEAVAEGVAATAGVALHPRTLTVSRTSTLTRIPESPL